VQFNNASDLQYPVDFPLETTNNGDPAMEDRMSFSHSSDNFFWMVDSSYYTNLLQSNPQAGNDNSVQRLPELHAEQSLSKIGDSDFLYSWSTDYTNFTRDSFGFDTMNAGYVPGGTRYLLSNGTDPACSTNLWEQNPNCHAVHNANFNSNTDLIRTGTRLDSNMQVEHPVHVGRIDFLPAVSYRETDYEFNTGTNNTAIRQYFRGDLGARTVFGHVYDGEGQERMKHEIEPEVNYSNIFWINQPNNPFFGANAQASPFTPQNNVSDADLNSPYGLQFDYFDRTYNRNIVTAALTNRLVQKSWDKDKDKDKDKSDPSPTYSELLSWKVAQSYDIYQANGNPAYQPWGDTLSELSVHLKNFVITQRYDYFPYQEVNDSSTRIKILDSKKDFVQFGYDLSYNLVPGQPVDPTTRTEQYSFTVKKSVKLIDLLGKVIYDANPTGGAWINSYGVAAQLRMPGDCLFLRLMLYRPPGGTDNFLASFDFAFDGNPRPGLSEAILDQFSF
jgi:LPS-assembly protein